MNNKHGFKTREEWQVAFEKYFLEIENINQISYLLLNEHDTFPVWLKKYKTQSQVIQKRFHNNSQFIEQHVHYFKDHPNDLTQQMRESLVAFLFRCCMHMQDTEAVYIAIELLREDYEKNHDEIGLMKCYYVLSIIYMYLNLHNYFDMTCKKYAFLGKSLYEKHYDELNEEEKSLGITFYDISGIFQYSEVAMTKDFSKDSFYSMKSNFEDGLKRIELFLKTADLTLEVNSVFPAMQECLHYDFITMTLRIPKAAIQKKEKDYIYCLTKQQYENVIDNKGANQIKKWKASLSYTMAKRLNDKISDQETIQTIQSILTQIPDFQIFSFEDYDETQMDLLVAFSASIQTLAQDSPYDVTELAIEILRKLKKFIISLPYFRFLQHVADECIFLHILPLIRYLPTESEMMKTILDLTIYRQMQTAIHSKMVAYSATIITEGLLEYQPEYFLQEPSLLNREQVLSKKTDILEFVHKGAMLHDVGKVLCANTINTQYRKITDLEFKAIQFHPITSGKILEQVEALKKYHDIAIGHHKSYDGKRGYPEEFDNLQSPDKMFIDLISICDSLDAATDSFGRNYAQTKTFQQVMNELNDEKGTRYSDVLVNFILEHRDIYERLEKLFTIGREEVYHEVYDMLIKNERRVNNV